MMELAPAEQQVYSDKGDFHGAAIETGLPATAQNDGPDESHEEDDAQDANDEGEQQEDLGQDVGHEHMGAVTAVGQGAASQGSQGQELMNVNLELRLQDIMPLEPMRAQFLQLILNHFVTYHVVPAELQPLQPPVPQMGHSPLKKKKKPDPVYFEGDSRYVLPGVYLVNLYETLVAEVDMRMQSIEALRGKTIGLALEAAGGIHRRLLEKYPKPGTPGATTTFRRREMTTTIDVQAMFPELITNEVDRRIRVPVIHGLRIVEQPDSLTEEQSIWFRRLTGRALPMVTGADYKFPSHRRKPHRSPYAKAALSNVSYTSQMVMGSPTYVPRQPKAHKMQPQLNLQYAPPPVGAVVPVAAPGLVGPKYCDECGFPYVRETSKFCSECGTRRPGT